ncbi:B-cell CLL/lymphoma 9 protein [Lates japonicus]|uniref:B-cell CLL/lymphoma 9 protein n=1 Tax=Lates japonicus TaxID=270547 RepID=A0AAD3RG00_LATJO|nr:B-cell CLL/lymphoma 9 protein [Lates japonicus]
MGWGSDGLEDSHMKFEHKWPRQDSKVPKPKAGGCRCDHLPSCPPSTAVQMDSKILIQGKPGALAYSQPSPCDPKTLGTKGAQENVLGGMGLKNGGKTTSGPKHQS